MLELRNLTKVYKSKNGPDTIALKGITYAFPEKGLVFIVGKSGSGKSTMLNILGLLDSYDEGELLINGRCAKEFTQNERDSWRALNIGFVFQEFHIIQKYSIGQNISLSLEIQEQKADRAKIADALKKVDLEGLEKRKSSELSGGQRQRVAIARALVKDPKIILADEPTGNLDSENSKAIFGLLKKLSANNLVVVISHDAESAATYADEILYLEDGLISEIRQGNDFFETIEHVVSDGKFDAQKVDEQLRSGKKVVLIPEVKKKPQAPRPTTAFLQDTRTTRLPASSKFKLSMLAMKSKLVRMMFTILLSCVAISFLGFSDIIGQYDTLKLIKSDIADSHSPFVSVSAQSITESGMMTEYDSIYMLENTQKKLEQTLEQNNIEYLRKYAAPSINFVYDTPAPEYSNPYNRSTRRFFRSSTEFFVEVPDDYDFADIGVELTGRLPQNGNEVVITNYHLEAYKRLGFVKASAYSHKFTGLRYRQTKEINDFADLEGEYLSNGNETTFRLISRYKIVGMLNFDLSDYSQFFDMPAGTKLSKEQADNLEEAITDFHLYFGNLYVGKDFANTHLNAHINYANSSFKVTRGENEQSMDRAGQMILGETCWPFSYSDYIPEANMPQDAEVSLISEFTECTNIITEGAKFEWGDEKESFTLTERAFDPQVIFRLRNNLTVNVDNPTITIDANTYGGKIQFFYRSFNESFSEFKSVRLDEHTQTATLPINAGEAIIEIRIDIEETAKVEIYDITIDGLAYYNGIDEYPNIFFDPSFTPDDLSTATNKVVLDINTLRDLLDEEIESIKLPDDPNRRDYQDYFEEILASGVNLSNFTALVEKRISEAVMVGVYQFEVVGIVATSGRAFYPTADYAEQFAVNASRDYLIPREKSEEAAVSLLGVGLVDSLPQTPEAINTWIDYSGSIRFILRTTHSGAIFTIDSYFKLFVNIFNMASVVFCLFAMLLTYNFVASSISARKKDIGILRSLGAKRMDIGWIFIIEAVFIAILEIILSCVLTMIMFGALNKYFISTMGALAQKYTLVSYTIRQILIMTAVALAATAISVALPIFRITQKQPVDIIKSND